MPLSHWHWLSRRRRHRAAGLVVLLFGLLAVGAVYSAAVPNSKATADDSAQSQQIEEGRKLFAVSCASCHGLNAEGGKVPNSKGEITAPSLIGVGAAAVDFQVGTGRMPAQQPGAQIPAKPVVFSPEEIAALSAYVASLAPGPAIPPESAYDISNACHNFAGQGGALPRGRYAPSLMGVDPKYMYLAMLTGPQQMPVFSDHVMTSEDKRDIIAYVKAMEKRDDPGGFSLGRLGPVTEGLFGWLFGIGALIAVAVWIGTKGVKARRKAE